jgi:hypothetical protein
MVGASLPALKFLVATGLFAILVSGCLAPIEHASGDHNAPLREGTLFHYYAPDDDSFVDMTIKDVNARIRGEDVIEVYVKIYNETVTRDYFNYYFNKTNWGVTMFDDLRGVRGATTCDFYSVYPLEEAVRTCQMILNESPLGGSTSDYEKKSFETTVSVIAGDYDVAYSEWTNGDWTVNEAWFSLELGFFVKLYWEGPYYHGFATPELVSVSFG